MAARVENVFVGDVFKYYVCFSSVLVLKMMFMTLLTIKKRFEKRVFSSPEDGTYRKITIKYNDEDIERTRRAHRNDVENIPLFIFVAFFYCMVLPDEGEAFILFLLYTAARFTHTFVYAIYVVPQPARVLAFFIGFMITVYMAIKVLIKTF